jgi:hypothetical protein
MQSSTTAVPKTVAPAIYSVTQPRSIDSVQALLEFTSVEIHDDLRATTLAARGREEKSVVAADAWSLAMSAPMRSKEDAKVEHEAPAFDAAARSALEARQLANDSTTRLYLAPSSPQTRSAASQERPLPEIAVAAVPTATTTTTTVTTIPGTAPRQDTDAS